MKATATFTSDVEVIINDPDVIARITGEGGDEWRSQFYGIRTEDEVIEHLAYNCVANGCKDARMLDGWADLPPEAVQMRVVGGYEPFTVTKEK